MEPRGLIVHGEPSLALVDAWGCWGRCWECFCSQKAAPKARAVGRLSRRASLWMPRTGCVSQGCSNVQGPCLVPCTSVLCALTVRAGRSTRNAASTWLPPISEGTKKRSLVHVLFTVLNSGGMASSDCLQGPSRNVFSP